MAEVLALIVTVASLADLAGKAAFGLRNAYQTIENASGTIQRLSRDLDAFHAATQTLLSTLRSFHDKALVLQVAPFDHMVVAINNCKHTIEMVRKTVRLDEVEGHVWQEIKMNWMQRFRLLIKQGEFKDLLVDLEREKSTLNFSVEILMVQILVADRYPILNESARRSTAQRMDSLMERLGDAVLLQEGTIIADELTEEPDFEPRDSTERQKYHQVSAAAADEEVIHEPISKPTDPTPISPQETASTHVLPRQHQETDHISAADDENLAEKKKSDILDSSSVSTTQAIAEVGDDQNQVPAFTADANNISTVSLPTNSSLSTAPGLKDTKTTEGKNINPNPLKQLEFMMAILEGQNDDVQRYLRGNQHQININEVESTQGQPPITFAVVLNHISTVKSLIAAGANVNIADKNGFAPLGHALKNTNLELMKILLDAGADTLPQVLPNWDIYGPNTYLTEAVRMGRGDIVDLLVEANVDINNPAHIEGGTWAAATSPLVKASYNRGDATMTRRLLEAHADPNAPSGCMTPLLAAAHSGNAGGVEVLLEYNADPDLRHSGHKPRDMLESNQELRRILLRHAIKKSMKEKAEA